MKIFKSRPWDKAAAERPLAQEPAACARSNFQRRIVPACLAVLLLLSGCKGIPTQGERGARRQIATVGNDYRPHNQKPVLPNLSTSITLEELLRFAMLNSPQVESAYYDWAASIERITTARSWPDPQLTFQMDIQSIVTSVMPGFMVNFPAPGKLRAQAAVASDESQAKYFGFQSSVLLTAFSVKKAAYELQILEQKIQVARQTLGLLNDLEQLARTQNEVGKVPLQDVLRAQIERDKLQIDLANLEDSRGQAMARYRAALGLKDTATTPPLPKDLDSSTVEYTPEKLLELAQTKNPRLKAIEAEVRMAEASIALAEKSRRPETSLGLMADVKMNPFLYRPLGTISLPIWRDKIAAQIAEAQANKHAAAARLSAEQISIAVEFAEQMYAVREATRTLDLLDKQLIPKTQQSLELARIGYLSGQIDFFNLIDTQRSLLAFDLAKVEARLQREVALAELSLGILGARTERAPMLRIGGGMAGASSGSSAGKAMNMR